MCEHAATPDPDQGQLRGAGGYRGHQGQGSEVTYTENMPFSCVL